MELAAKAQFKHSKWYTMFIQLHQKQIQSKAIPVPQPIIQRIISRVTLARPESMLHILLERHVLSIPLQSHYLCVSTQHMPGLSPMYSVSKACFPLLPFVNFAEKLIKIRRLNCRLGEVRVVYNYYIDYKQLG